jgi:hypothetical protein
MSDLIGKLVETIPSWQELDKTPTGYFHQRINTIHKLLKIIEQERITSSIEALNNLKALEKQ